MEAGEATDANPSRPLWGRDADGATSSVPAEDVLAASGHLDTKRGPSWPRELSATLALGLPLIGAQLAQIAINATDTLMMGRLGPAPLGAGGLATTLVFLFVITGIGITAAVSVMIAQERGANPHAVRGVRRTVRQGGWIVSAIALVALVVLWNGQDVLLLLGQDADLALRAEAYFRAAMWAVPFSLWFLVLRAFVSALERTVPILLVTLGAILANAGLNWILMFGNLGFPALGLRGAGIATVIVNAGMVLALGLVIAFDRRMRRYSLLGRFWRPDRERLVELLRIGLPVTGLLLAEVGAFAASTLLSGRVGATTLAAHLIALQITSIAFMVPLGLSQATTIRVGLAFGRGDPSSVALAGNVSLAAGGVLAVLLASLFVLVPHALVALFLGPNGGDVARLAAGFLLIAALFKLVDAGQVILAGALRGLGDTRVPLVAGLVGYWLIGLPTGAALAFGWLGEARGGNGVWLGLTAGLTSVCVLLGWRWWAQMKALSRGEPVAGTPLGQAPPS